MYNYYLNTFPKLFSNKSILVYIFILASVSVFFMDFIMDFTWILFGFIEVFTFFFFFNKLSIKWKNISTHEFFKKIFIFSLVIRLVYIVFSFVFYLAKTGQPFEFGESIDSLPYHLEGVWVSQLISSGNLDVYFNYITNQGSISDLGYPFFLGLMNYISGDSILFSRLFNAIFDTFTVLLVYKISTRNFGESTGRIAAIMCMLMPYMIYFTGMHLKESLMTMLVVLFIERSDSLIRSAKFKVGSVAVIVFVGLFLFLFRTVLGVVAFLSLFTALVFSSKNLIGYGKKILLSIIFVIALFFVLGDSITKEVEETWEARSKNQTENLKWRSEREGGNNYAKYLGGAVFAPMIFVIPFPTVVSIPTQINQQYINGGNFVKNIVAFFIFISLFFLLKNKNWKNHILIISFTVGYLLVIAFSAFAHSGRFHMPVIPFELIFAAVGLSQINNVKYKRYFNIYILFIFISIFVWTWFKLSGRGLV